MATRPMTEADLLRPAFEGIGGPSQAMPETGIEFEFPEEGGQMLDGALMSEAEDGSLEVDFEPAEEAEEEESEHDENLCEYMSGYGPCWAFRAADVWRCRRFRVAR